MKITVELPENELAEICEITGISKKGPAIRKLLAEPCKANAAPESPADGLTTTGLTWAAGNACSGVSMTAVRMRTRGATQSPSIGIGAHRDAATSVLIRPKTRKLVGSVVPPYLR